MRYEVIHRTTYRYDSEVSVSHHLIRVTPRQRAHQSVYAHRIDVEPAPTVLTPRTDYYGNVGHYVTVERAHSMLDVVARSEVKVDPAHEIDPARTPAWEEIREACLSGVPWARRASEFCFISPLVPRSADLAGYAAASFPAGRPVLDAAIELNSRIHADFEFDPHATTVATPVEEVFAQRRGVCQDFAHFEIACLRSLGIPARYVSGYLETVAPPGREKLIGADASHAWVQVFCGEPGWADLDPTNNLRPNEWHVTVGWGRDFGDVSPVRGVVVGSGADRLEVSVDVTPMAAQDEPTAPAAA